MTEGGLVSSDRTRTLYENASRESFPLGTARIVKVNGDVHVHVAVNLTAATEVLHAREPHDREGEPIEAFVPQFESETFASRLDE